MRRLSLVVMISALVACASSASYSRRDIVEAVRIVSAQRGDNSNWDAGLPIKDKSYSAEEASAAVRTALRERWCKSGGTPPVQGAVDPNASLAAARQNPNAAQLAAATPDIRC